MTKINGELKSALDQYVSGFSLPKDFYLNPNIHQQEMELLFYNHWIHAANEADLPEPGDFVSLNIGERSVFLVRNSKGAIQGFYNVCRHRGHSIVNQEKGHSKVLTCPYHKWSYNLEGKLLAAKGAGKDFPCEDYALQKIAVESVGGLLFISLSENPSRDIFQVKERLEPYIIPYNLKETKIAAQSEIVELCNWKLVIENNRECLHCLGSHPELLIPLHNQGFGKGFESEATITQSDLDFECLLTKKESEWESLNLPYKLIEFPQNLWLRTVRLPLANECLSHTVDPDHACKKLLGKFGKAEGSGLSVWTHPNSWNHFLYDHIVTFTVFPLSVDRTLVRTKWLVAKDAVEGVDYHVKDLTNVWTKTNLQDQSLAEGSYRGIKSGGHSPGPVLEEEYLVKQFLDWYTGELQSQLNGNFSDGRL